MSGNKLQTSDTSIPSPHFHYCSVRSALFPSIRRMSRQLSKTSIPFMPLPDVFFTRAAPSPVYFSRPAVLAYEVSYEYGMKTAIAGLHEGVSSHVVFRGFQQLPVQELESGTKGWNFYNRTRLILWG